MDVYDIKQFSQTEKEVYTCHSSELTYSCIKQNGNDEYLEFSMIIGNSPYFVLNSTFDESYNESKDSPWGPNNEFLIKGNSLSGEGSVSQSV